MNCDYYVHILRGDFATLQRKEVVVHTWKDNKIVMVMSTNCQPTAIGNVQRKKHDGSQITVSCPESIILYNKYMGGVDRGDQLRGYYKCYVKSRKFYKYIFFFLFDVSITNAYIMYKMSGTNRILKNIKDFRLELARQLIGEFSNRRRAGRVSRIIKPLPILHFPTRIRCDNSISKRGKCTHCSRFHRRRTNTTWYCKECQVWLCHTGHEDTDCFLIWHKKLEQ